jgi:hypothetical protein
MPRPLLEQQFTTFALTVETTPTPVNSGGNLTDMIETFTIAVPSTAANSVFFGNNNVTTTSGLEIQAGAIFVLAVNQARQLYETQLPLDELVRKVACNAQWMPENIPFICWNLANIYLIAAAATSVSITTFRTPFI